MLEAHLSSLVRDAPSRVAHVGAAVGPAHGASPPSAAINWSMDPRLASSVVHTSTAEPRPGAWPARSSPPRMRRSRARASTASAGSESPTTNSLKRGVAPWMLPKLRGPSRGWQ